MQGNRIYPELRRRHSASQSFAQERKRLRKMSIEECVLEALGMADRFLAFIKDALQTASMVLRSGSRLKLVPLPQRVAPKLYAGGLKSKADLVELLRRNPDAGLDKIAETCNRYRLRGLDEVLREMERQQGESMSCTCGLK